MACEWLPQKSPEGILMYNHKLQLHFVGIGGVGMAGIAEVLLNLGYSVTGSDLHRNALIRHLEELGAVVNIGHQPENIRSGTSVVIVSSAVRQDNPELLEAHLRGIPIIPRAEMLAELMRMKYSIGVAGSHGKTTTTTMIAHILAQADLDPTLIVGGRVLTINSGARVGKGEYLVAETDESDGSFCLLRPAIGVVTNIDAEHLGHYGSFGALEQAFQLFMSSVPFYGVVVACFDDPLVMKLASTLKRRVLSYGFSAEHQVSASNIVIDGPHSHFDLSIEGKSWGRLTLPVPGTHMVSNALAAISVAYELAVPQEVICSSLESFPGVARRSQVVYSQGGMLVIDDYAHHPTEIKATLTALRSGWLSGLQKQNKMSKPGRLIALFQPHRFTRTRDLFSEFIVSFSNADEVIVGEIYAASEDAIVGVSGEKLAQALQHQAVSYVRDLESIVDSVAQKLSPGDVVVTLGAGNVTQIASRLAERLEQLHGA